VGLKPYGSFRVNSKNIGTSPRAIFGIVLRPNSLTRFSAWLRDKPCSRSESNRFTIVAKGSAYVSISNSSSTEVRSWNKSFSSELLRRLGSFYINSFCSQDCDLKDHNERHHYYYCGNWRGIWCNNCENYHEAYVHNLPFSSYEC